ncbi:MAG TPA: hypothetical protein VKT21_04940 [Thermoplasmata archaeon]|nr:hypothetical protein [Thermoplasmata archaeon]
MTTIKTLAAHELVRLTYPRPPTEHQELGMAVGKAIDSTLSRYSHDYERGLRPTIGAMSRLASSILDQELVDIDLSVATTERAHAQEQIVAVLQAFRKTEVFGLPRPKTRMILIDDQVGVYTQPDYWDRKHRFYEMKSYRAVPPPPDVTLQLRLFQLGFAGLDGFLVCVNRHVTPPDVSITPVPRTTPEESLGTLRLALYLGLQNGREKVLEFIDSPVVRYSVGSRPENDPG